MDTARQHCFQGVSNVCGSRYMLLSKTRPEGLYGGFATVDRACRHRSKLESTNCPVGMPSCATEAKAKQIDKDRLAALKKVPRSRTNQGIESPYYRVRV